jgi:hypothetical protein
LALEVHRYFGFGKNQKPDTNNCCEKTSEPVDPLKGLQGLPGICALYFLNFCLENFSDRIPGEYTSFLHSCFYVFVYLFIYLLIYLFTLKVLEFELKTSKLLCRHSTA